MAKPPRQAARKVSFTPAAAQRIASVVLKAEAGSRDSASPGRRSSSGGDELVRATFTAPWAKGDTKTCVDANLPAVQYDAKNLFAAITGSAEKTCVLAYVSGEWLLIACEC